MHLPVDSSARFVASATEPCPWAGTWVAEHDAGSDVGERACIGRSRRPNRRGSERHCQLPRRRQQGRSRPRRKPRAGLAGECAACLARRLLLGLSRTARALAWRRCGRSWRRRRSRFAQTGSSWPRSCVRSATRDGGRLRWARSLAVHRFDRWRPDRPHTPLARCSDRWHRRFLYASSGAQVGHLPVGRRLISWRPLISLFISRPQVRGLSRRGEGGRPVDGGAWGTLEVRSRPGDASGGDGVRRDVLGTEVPVDRVGDRVAEGSGALRGGVRGWRCPRRGISRDARHRSRAGLEPEARNRDARCVVSALDEP